MMFDWDDSNEQHLARHGVSRFDAEQALADPLGQILETTVEDDEIRYLQIGATVQGRLLVVVFTMRDDAVRPITAFDSDRHLARVYREG